MEFYKVPWRLVPNKLVRYPGGREIDRFRGVEPALDNGRPEAWVGSDCIVYNTEEMGNPYEGRAEVDLPDGKRVYLYDMLQSHPEEILGEKHMAVSGKKLGVLVKLLDAQYQLGLQSHPTREYAKKAFNSDYGKAESWIVIGMRDDVPEPPYMYLGFKEGMTREKFAEPYYRDDIRSMEECCHKVQVKMGDVFFVGAGLPHAIGAGCFVVEVQEPSDITVGAERLCKRQPDVTEEEEAAYDNRLLDTYIYDGCTYEENLKRWLIDPLVIREGDWGKEVILIGPNQTDYFSCTRIDVKGSAPLRTTGFVQIGIVVEGSGKLVYDGGEMEVKRGDELFLPYGVENAEIVSPEGVGIIWSHPPGAKHQ